MNTRIKKAGGGNPPATTVRQPSSYRQLAPTSRANLLEQAAEVLLVLAFFPVTETTRLGLLALLDCRLRRAYEGMTP
ncbi:MAG: hypothetical protein JW741_06155 [Sedimentisphaerales bacterium]|nr:hypothetical protein [Sedimentisphaerales bacterium]